ncbi:unnamed protein product [Caenorhabditis brenneri]
MPKLSLKSIKKWLFNGKKQEAKAILPCTPPEPKGIPLLNFSYFSQLEILRNLDFSELIQLSLLSAKSRAVVKSILPKSHKIMTINFGKSSNTITVSTNQHIYMGSYEHVDQVLDLFDYPETVLSIGTDRQLDTITEFIQKYKDCVRLIYFTTPVFYPDLVELVNSVQGLEFSMIIEVHGEFRFICTEFEIQINNPHPFFVPHIWRLNFSIVKVNDVNLSFLNFSDWIYGRFPSGELKQLIVGLEFPEDLDTMMSDAGVTVSKEEWEHPVYGPIDKSYRVRRADNTKEAILFEYCDDFQEMMVMEIESCVPRSLIF